MDDIIDIQKYAAAKRAEQEAKAQPEATDTSTQRVYEVNMKDGESLQVSGVLMLTGSFFAIGMPVGQAVDFSFAAPAENINFIVALDDEDLQETAD